MMPNVILHQTADADRFFPMLAASLQANRAFCERNGVRLEAFIGIRRGRHPWHATFNRLAMIRDLLAKDFDGWLIYLDADAFVPNSRFDLNKYLAGHADTAMIHPPGGGGEGDVIAGVFLWNFARPETRRLAQAWLAAFDALTDEELEAAPEWNLLIDESALLRRLLRADPELGAAIHIESDQLIGYPHSSFIRQFLRNGLHSTEERIARVVQAVQIALQRSGMLPSADEKAIQKASAVLREAQPDLLEAALERHEAAALAVAMAQICQHKSGPGRLVTVDGSDHQPG